MISAGRDMAPRKLGGLLVALQSPRLALTLAAFLWSGNFIAGRALRDEIDPVSLNFIRWLIALAILTPFVWRDLMTRRMIVRREWLLLLALGATGISVFNVLVYVALQTTTATNALLILSLAPTAILAAAVLVGMERCTSSHLVGALVSLVGAAILITRAHFETIAMLRFNVGDMWMLVSIVVWAAYSLLLRRRPSDLPERLTLALSVAVALLLMLPFLALGQHPRLATLASPLFFLSIGYVAVLSSIFAFSFWSYGVSRLGASRAAQYINLMPVFGAALAVSVLGETLTLVQIAGAVFVFAGIAIVGRESGLKRELPGSEGPTNRSHDPGTADRITERRLTKLEALVAQSDERSRYYGRSGG
jgi:drug/metabolite transporter (DMT)-like permease